MVEGRGKIQNGSWEVIGLLTLALLLIMPGTPAKAEVIADATLATDYIYRGLDNLEGSPAFQPTVTWIIGSTGFDVNAWFNWGLANRGSSRVRDFDEVDLTASYRRPVGNLLLRMGVFHLSWYGQPDYPDDYSTVNEVFAGVSHANWPLQPTLTVNYELAEADGHDLYVQARLGHDLLFGTGPSLFLGLSAGYYKADWLGRDGISDINIEMGTTLVQGLYALTPRFMVTFVPLDEVNPNHLVFWASMTLTRVWTGGV